MKNKLDLNQKFAKLLIDLRKIRPFYSSVYECIDKIADESIPTAAVDGKRLLYNTKFLDEISYPEFVFVILHELGHISLMHVSRGLGKDPAIWNVACDLVVNKLLAEEFGVIPGKIVNVDGVDIMMPLSVLYSDTLDSDNDYTEDLYHKLESQSSKNGYNENGVGTFSISGGNKASGNNIFKKLMGKHKQTNKNQSVMESPDTVTIYADDSDEFISGCIDKQQQEFEEKRVLAAADTKLKMSGSCKGIGSNASKMQVFVEEMLKSKLDWRKLLQKYCIMIKNLDSSFSCPDKRMSYQSCIYPGQYDESQYKLENIKVAIDTSGSISTDDFRYIIGQINDIIKKYKVEAELICWDTEVESVYNFNNINDIYAQGFTGRGGTDPTCLFNYFDSKKCKVKPNVILIFTDGFFLESMLDNKKWNKKYKNTIWVMTRNYDRYFEPKFGKLAVAKFNT